MCIYYCAFKVLCDKGEEGEGEEGEGEGESGRGLADIDFLAFLKISP